MKIHFEYAYDRLDVWLDHSEYPGSIEDLRPHCRDLRLVLGQQPYGARWKLKLKLLQPTTECLKLLLCALGTEVEALPVYAEIATDLIPLQASLKNAPKLEKSFLASAVPKYHRLPAVCFQGTTWYFGRRCNDEGVKRANVLVAYASRRSKLNNQACAQMAKQCLHIEWRITGSPALEKHGIRALGDLIDFDHKKFWTENLRFYSLPKTTELGRLLCRTMGGKMHVGARAFHKRASTWLAMHSVEKTKGDNKFVLYNALLDGHKKEFNHCLITFEQWKTKVLSNTRHSQGVSSIA